MCSHYIYYLIEQYSCGWNYLFTFLPFLIYPLMHTVIKMFSSWMMIDISCIECQDIKTCMDFNCSIDTFVHSQTLVKQLLADLISRSPLLTFPFRQTEDCGPQ